MSGSCCSSPLGFGAIGFYDDYLKVTKQSHHGFSGRARLAGEFADRRDRVLTRMTITGHAGRDLAGACPSSTATSLDLGWASCCSAPFVIVAFGNAVNLTDGLDGLAIVPVMIAAATFGLISYFAGNSSIRTTCCINHMPNAGELMVVCGALIGAGVGFLWFNAPPAQIFMGDTGSLALGGLLGTIAVAIKHEIVLAIVGGLFVMEALSRDRAGRLVQADRQARVPDGADPSSFRAARLVGAADRHALLDRRLRAGAGRPRHLEAEVSMTPVSTFAGQARRAVRPRRLRACRPRARWSRAARRSPRWDDGEAARAKAAAAGCALVDLAAADWSSFASLVLSPGVPLTHPKPHWTVERAKAAGVEVIGDIELFARERAARAPDAPLRRDHRHQRQVDDDGADRPRAAQAGRDVRSAAISACRCSILRRRRRTPSMCIECSSFQIDLAPSLEPSVGLLINLTPDHLDRHGTMENYAAIKERLVAGR